VISTLALPAAASLGAAGALWAFRWSAGNRDEAIALLLDGCVFLVAYMALWTLTGAGRTELASYLAAARDFILPAPTSTRK